MTKIGTEEEAEMDRVKNTKSWRYWLLGVAAAAAALAGGQAQAQVQPGTQIIPTLTCENTPGYFQYGYQWQPQRSQLLQQQHADDSPIDRKSAGIKL